MNVVDGLPEEANEAIAASGRWLGSVVADPIKGIIADQLNAFRWKRQVRFVQKAKEFLREQGLDEPGKNVPLKAAFPIIQAALMEDDDSLQDKWARLLASHMATSSNTSIPQAFTSVLGDLAADDAKLLDMIYKFAPAGERVGMWTLPDRIASKDEQLPPEINKAFDADHYPTESILGADLAFRLDNLVRLNLLADDTVGQSRIWVRITTFGRRFCAAVAT